MIDLREVRSVTEFQRNIKEYVGRLKEMKTPLVLSSQTRARVEAKNAESSASVLDRFSLNLRRRSGSSMSPMAPKRHLPHAVIARTSYGWCT